MKLTLMEIFQTLGRLEEAIDALLNPKSSANSSSLQEGLKAEVKKKLINCSGCTKSFANLRNLKTHMRVHTGEKPHTCPQCTKSFSNLSNLQSHLKGRCHKIFNFRVFHESVSPSP
jgi:uncharacterized Zn-finger protein